METQPAEILSPIESAIFTASSVHEIITSEGEARKALLLSLLKKYHGIAHVGRSDVDQFIYDEWCQSHADLKKRVMDGKCSPDDLVHEDASITPPCVSRYLSMEIGQVEELNTLSLVEKHFNDKVKEKAEEGDDPPQYIVESDQKRRLVRMCENKIQIVGRYDAFLKAKTSKRPVVGIIEIKTRMSNYRDNPADKTQVCIYSKMMPKVTVYALVERIRSTQEVKVTRWKYEELDEHWKSFVEPGLRKVHVEFCALWRQRMEPSDEHYIGNTYATYLIALIDHLRAILKAQDGVHGMVLLPPLLNELRYEIENNKAASYKAICARLTPAIIHKVQQKDLDFFEENILVLAAADGKYEEKIKQYTGGVAKLLRDGITDKTRDKTWALVSKVLDTV